MPAACLDSALAYASRGWRVLALSPNAKIPLKDTKLQPNGSLSATTDPAVIRELWETYPLAGVGVATGKESNLTVVDLDGPDASAALKDAGLYLPQSYIVKTRKGYHIYCSYDPDLRQGAGLLPHLDVRNDGGYVVAPPTTIDGITYAVHKDRPIKEWPELTAYIAQHRAKVNTQKANIEHPGWVAELLVKGAPEGQRNDAASRLAGYFRSINIPQDIALASLLGFARSCNPPMAEGELQAVVTSVWRYSPSKAITYQGHVLPVPIVDATSERRRRFIWPDSGLQVLTDRLRITNAGIECWLTISTAEHGDIYGPIKVNLLSDTARDALRRSLKERLEHDWQQVIQHVAKLTIASLDPASDLVDMGNYQPEALSPWLIEPFVRRKQPTVIYGDGGEGKSTLAIALGLSIASGIPIVPGITLTGTGGVYMLDFESDVDDSVAIAQNLAKGAGIAFPRERMFYRRLSGSLADHIDNIAPDFARHNITLVIVDSLMMSGGLDVNEAEAARLYFNSVRTFGCASLGVTHVTKGQSGESASKPFGSAYWWNLARVAWQVKRTQQEGQPLASLALYNRKSNRGGLHKTIGLTVRFDPDIITYQAADVQADPELAKGTSVADQIAWIMGGKLWSVAELKEEMPHLSENTIKGTLRRGEGKRFGKIPPSLKWGRLTEVQDDEKVRVPPSTGTRTSKSQGTTGTPPFRGDVHPAVPPPPLEISKEGVPPGVPPGKDAKGDPEW